jgi:hypothetical protein
MSQKTPEKDLILESNELTKQKEHENISKKTLLLKKSIQRVEDQGKRGKIKSVTTQITKELLDYIKQNFDGYSLLVLSYIILGALISIRKLFMTAFLDTDEFLSEKLGLAKQKISKNQSRAKGKNSTNSNNPLENNKEVTAETLRTLFNKSLMSEFEKFKSSKIHLNMDLFDKIQSTLYKMKIPTMIGGVSEQDVIKYEEEKIINPLFKKLFTEPLPNKAFLQLIKESQFDTQNFAGVVGINIESIVNKEGILDNGNFFPNNENNNEFDMNTGNDIEYNSTEKKGENIRMELIKINQEEKNNKEKNILFWKKDKVFFEFDIPTYLEMMKEDNENMTPDDIKNAFYKNLEKINNDENFAQYKKDLRNNKYTLKIRKLSDYDENVIKELKNKSIFGYFFYGRGNDLVNFIKNEILSSGKSSDLRRIDIGDILSSQKLELNNDIDKVFNDFKGKTYNQRNNYYDIYLDDSSPYEFNSQNKWKESSSKYLNEKIEKEERTSSEIIKQIKKVVENTKFYQNVKVESFVKKINENSFLISYYNEKEKRSFVFYNLLISSQSLGFNLQQINPFAEFFFMKNN